MTSKTYVAVAPSNIALQKYWGKIAGADQHASTPSISMTLSEAVTRTSCRLNSEPLDQFSFEGASKNDSKVTKACEIIRAETGLNRHLLIESRNTFPHGCGIASSASGMAALIIAGVACVTGSDNFASLESNGFCRSRLAQMARRCSGSAGRSLWGGYVSWDSRTQVIEPLMSSLRMRNVIVLVDPTPKAVSSSQGHLLADTSPFYPARLAGSVELFERLSDALRKGDLTAVGRIAEADAMDMHAVMMTSEPPLRYFDAPTAAVFALVRKWRLELGLECWFTLDAGPNPHVLSSDKDYPRVRELLDQQLPYQLIADGIGDGPSLEAIVGEP